MKLMIFANLGIGGLPTNGLASCKLSGWQKDRIQALNDALSDAKARGMEACVIAGGLFVKGFIPQSLLTQTFEEMKKQNVPILYAPLIGELDDCEGRIPSFDQLTIIEPVIGNGVLATIDIENLSIPVVEGAGLEPVEEVERPKAPLAIIRCGDDIGVSLAGGNDFRNIGPLEPNSYGDKFESGYLLVDLSDGAVSSEWVHRAMHPYALQEISLSGLEDSRELVTTVGEAVQKVNRDACLRVELIGHIPLDVYINTKDLAEQLGRYFYNVEVIDKCVVDIEMADLETDVSLLAEFVRQVMGDDSISETEKTRILRCGWNVLNGKDPVE